MVARILVIGSHTRGLFRPSRVNIHAASVLGRCDRPKLGYVGGWTARYRKLFKFAAWPKKGGLYAKPFGIRVSKWGSGDSYCAKLNIRALWVGGIIVSDMQKKSDSRDALAVRCPTCGAPPKTPCQLITGQPRTTPHRDRREIAKDPSARRMARSRANSCQLHNCDLIGRFHSGEWPIQYSFSNLQV